MGTATVNQNMRSRIYRDLSDLVADGAELDDIVVNWNDDRWGETAATTREAAQQMVDEWGQGSVDDLLPAREWLERELADTHV